jgi:hypothetical protein
MLWALSVTASAGGDPTKPSTAARSLTIQEQMKGWTPAQVARYNQKMAGLTSLNRPKRAAAAAATITPSIHYLNIVSQWEGAADVWCGPATISMMLGVWNINRSQQTVHDDLVAQRPPGYTDADGTYREGMRLELNNYDQGMNPYVWQNLGPGGSGTAGQGDLWNYTKDDIGNWNTPTGNNIETTSTYHPHPLWHYPTEDFKHYFPAYGYDSRYLNITVDDPHFSPSGSQDTYSYIDIWKAIDNFTTKWNGSGGFVPNQVLY